jgi:multicomponent K+:H+ antiporter subunit G
MSGQSLPLWVTIPGSVLLVLGGLATVIGSFGLLRLRDFFSRVHGPSMTNTVGAGAVLIASMLVSSAFMHRPSFHELLIALLVIMSAPVTSILLVQAALQRNKMRGGGPASGDVNARYTL